MSVKLTGWRAGCSGGHDYGDEEELAHGSVCVAGGVIAGGVIAGGGVAGVVGVAGAGVVGVAGAGGRMCHGHSRERVLVRLPRRAPHMRGAEVSYARAAERCRRIGRVQGLGCVFSWVSTIGILSLIGVSVGLGTLRAWKFWAR